MSKIEHDAKGAKDAKGKTLSLETPGKNIKNIQEH